MPGPSTQEFLFQRIKEKLPPTASLADVIAEKLFISNDSAYRRIRGETPLVLEEAKVLCEAFQLSLDELLKARQDSVSFSFAQVNSGDNSFKDYLLGILNNFKFITAAPEKEIFYLSKDIPVFSELSLSSAFCLPVFFLDEVHHPAPGFCTPTVFYQPASPGDRGIGERDYEALYRHTLNRDLEHRSCEQPDLPGGILPRSRLFPVRR